MRSNTERTDSSISRHRLTEKKFLLLTVSCILLLTILVYANSIENDFTNWDDPGLVIENLSIRSLSVDNLIKMFTPKRGATFQPVRVLSYAIDYHFWELNPVGYHLGNTILHGFAAILLYLALTSILKQIRGESFAESNRTISLITALLFAVHPVNVEAVAWVASRKYGLLAFFYFLSFYLFVKSSEKKKRYIGYYSLSVVIYVLALLSSPFSVTLPALLFLYDYCRSTTINLFNTLKQRFYYYLPYGILSICHFLILLTVLSAGPNPGVKSHYAGNPLYTLFTMLRVVYDYLKTLLFPLWLNNRYLDAVSFSFFEYKLIISLFLLLSIAIVIATQVRSRKRLILFCLGWFFITLLPVSNIIPISTKMADRYLYLPAVGLFLLFSVGLNHMVEIWFVQKSKQILIIFLVIPLVISLSYLSIQRNKIWANSQTLWEDSLSKAPNNHLAHLSLGEALHNQEKLEEAITHYLKALRLKPSYAEAYNNLGHALSEQGKIQEAISHYNKAIQFRPHYADPHNNLGVALARQGKLEEATGHLNEALRTRPEWLEAHNNLGNALAARGMFDEAIASFSEALRLNPNHAETHNNLAVALVQQGRPAEAVKHYNEAIRLKPNSAEAHNNLGVALVKLGRLQAAIVHYVRALQLEPDYAEVHNNMGNVLAKLGKLDKAIDHYAAALQIRANYAEAHNNLGVAHARQGKLDKAIANFSQALRLEPDYVQARTNLEIALQEAGNTDMVSTTGPRP